MATKTIRLAVAMDINGEWTARGWSVWDRLSGSHNAEDDYMAKAASDRVKYARGRDAGGRDPWAEVQFVEVDIELPQRPGEVRGKVVR